MRKRFAFLVFALLLGAVLSGALPLAAQAHDAYAAKDVHLRAGPARDYPVVAILPRGTQLDVQGCLSDYSWCDVIGGGERGWVYAANIDYVYQGTPVPLIDYGPVIGITVFGFFFDDYWDRWYRGRPWYHERDEWRRRPRPPQPPIPPRPRPPGWVPAPRPVQPSPGHPAPPPHTQPPPVRPGPPIGQPPPHREPPAQMPPPRREPPTYVPPPRSAEPGRPPVTRGDAPGPK